MNYKHVIAFCTMLLISLMCYAQKEVSRVSTQMPRGAGSMTYISYDDGSVVLLTKLNCPICKGNGVCIQCKGKGYQVSYSFWPPRTYPCSCGNGACGFCKGNGSIETTSIGRNKGFVVETITYDQYGRAHVSSSLTTSSSSRSSRSSNERVYVDQIEYAPCYSGDCPNVYCEKCKSFSPRHSHIKKRVD